MALALSVFVITYLVIVIAAERFPRPIAAWSSNVMLILASTFGWKKTGFFSGLTNPVARNLHDPLSVVCVAFSCWPSWLGRCRSALILRQYHAGWCQVGASAKRVADANMERAVGVGKAKADWNRGSNWWHCDAG